MITHVDDLPVGCIHSIKMLKEIFSGTEFEGMITQEFLEAYNQAKEKL